jgi:hypothetical protein
MLTWCGKMGLSMKAKTRWKFKLHTSPMPVFLSFCKMNEGICKLQWNRTYKRMSPQQDVKNLRINNHLRHTWYGLLSHAWKQPNLWDFPNLNENNNKLNPKSWLWNKKNKNKNTTCAKQKSNIIFLQGRNKNKTRFWQENLPKTGFEQTKGNREFYFYLYPLGT